MRGIDTNVLVKRPHRGMDGPDESVRLLRKVDIARRSTGDGSQRFVTAGSAQAFPVTVELRTPEPNM